MVFTSQMYSLNFVGMFVTILIMCANIIKNIEDMIISEHILRKRPNFMDEHFAWL